MRQLVGAFVAAVASRLMYHNIAGDAAALQHCRNGHFRRNEKGQGFGQGTLPMPWLTLPAFLFEWFSSLEERYYVCTK